ncbi:hypothetical protein FQR65_LT14513 [Abscondita terminalis]|nr:hypothetical protein FQR65_LT14513 [Abscondita terminalis]
MEDVLKDLIKLIDDKNRPDLQIITLDNILGLSGTADGLDLIAQQDLLDKLVSLLSSKHEAVKKAAALVLVNVSAAEDKHDVLLKNCEGFIHDLIESILDANSEIADSSCMILSNITRSSKHLEKVVNAIGDLEPILNVFTKTNHNHKGQNLYYLGPVFSNLSQSPSVRKLLLDTNWISKLLAFTEFADSLVKRGGVVGTIRNCCFDLDNHELLLSEEIDVLPKLLLPLAGNEEYDDEDNDKLPCDLQYLPSDKQREFDPDIRRMLLESLTKLCTLRKNREFIRNQHVYVILRELHKWEKDKKALLACENLVDILIRTETEIGEDNLQDIDVSDDLVAKFEKMDRDFLQDA